MVISLKDALTPPIGRAVDVDEDNVYNLLKVTYDGDVLKGETISGDDLSYKRLYKVDTWDCGGS